MPNFFAFQQGSESHTPPPPDSRYGRFRLIPDSNQSTSYGNNHHAHHNNGGNGSSSRPGLRTYGSIRGGGNGSGGGGGSISGGGGGAGSWGRASGARRGSWGGGGGGYGDDWGGGRGGNGGGYDDYLDEEDEDEEGGTGAGAGQTEDVRWWLEKWVLSPRRPAVRIIVGSWWKRVGVLIVLPAATTIIWCAIPFPTYPLDDIPPPPLPSTPPGSNTTSQSIYTNSSTYSTSFSSSSGSSNDPLPGTTTTTTAATPQLFLQILASKINHTLSGPGHGEALVRLNFWFFLLIYYGFYNLVGLMWITKLFNLYSLNWWPSRLGFPLSYTIFWSISLLLAVPLYLNENLIRFTSYNMTWILLTFATMTWPLLVAFLVLVSEYRHLSLPARYGGNTGGLSETQALFHPPPRRHTLAAKPLPSSSGGGGGGLRKPLSFTATHHLTSHSTSSSSSSSTHTYLPPPTSTTRPRSTSTTSSLNPLTWTTHLPSSYLRFLWFISLLLLSLLAYFLGESYAEIYLRTLPHNNLENILYVYSWVLTIHTLDFLTSHILTTYILSYPLEWVFKLFFALTYQTFVRALYARLRSPQQFLVLQAASTVAVVGWYLVSVCEWFHTVLVWCGLCTDALGEYRRYLSRGIFLRGVAENVSMVAWVGWVVVLHYGRNKSVYPYFAFESGTGGWWPGGGGGDGDGDGEGVGGGGGGGGGGGERGGGPGGGGAGGGDGSAKGLYTFELTFFASLATWACEALAGRVVRAVLKKGFGVDVEREARKDLVRYPELVGAGVVVGVHVLQNMLVGIVRVRFS